MPDRACGIIHVVICDQDFLPGIVQIAESVEFPLICFVANDTMGNLDQIFLAGFGNNKINFLSRKASTFQPAAGTG